MKTLRIIRMIVAALFLAATVAFFLTADNSIESIHALRAHNVLSFSQSAQVVPSDMIISTSLATGMGALLFWLCATFFMGRIYCSTVCPVGTLSDVFMRLRRELGKLFPKRLRLQFRFKEATRVRYHIMALYFVCLVIGLLAIPFAVEPWNMARNAASIGNHSIVESTWGLLGVHMFLGVGITGVVTLSVVAVWGFIAGRDFCNVICPIGQAMALIDRYALLHIEFDPDRCISCLQCEEVCRSSCIKVTERRVDNSRCVKCLDCVAICPANAIRLQANRNRAATPLAEGV